MSDHWVYVVINKSATAIKIGRCETEDLVDKRLSSLQTGNHEQLQTIARLSPDQHPGERVLHTRFRDYRLTGEWFDVDGPVIDWVIEICDKQKLKDVRRMIGRAATAHDRPDTKFHVELVFKAAWNIGPSELAQEITKSIRGDLFTVEDVGLIRSVCERYLDHKYSRALDRQIARGEHARRLHQLHVEMLDEANAI